MSKLGIEAPRGVHAGIHCFRHGVTSELLESGAPIHVVTRLVRHADPNVTLKHYAHIFGDTERVVSESFLSGLDRASTNWSQLPNWSHLPQLRPREKRTWRKRVGVEPTIRPAKGRIAGFEGREDHRTLFASAGCVSS
jgi:Phage integrase family